MHRRPRGTIILFATFAVVFALTNGCTRDTRYRVLSSLFDGVEHPDSVLAREIRARERAAERARAAESTQVRRAKLTADITVFKHPPFEEGDCTVCHESGASRSFSGTARLVAPVRELCVMCHDDKTPETLRAENAWVHGPAAAGVCTGCHNPHQSTREHLLLADAGRELCARCHVGNSAPTPTHHQDVKARSCLECHSPHASTAMALRPAGASKAAAKAGGGT